LNEHEIKNLIQRIVTEVIARISGFGLCDALAIVPGLTAYGAEAAEYLGGRSAKAALFGDAEAITGVEGRRVENAADKKAALRALREASEVVLVAPSISLLCAAASGDDCCFEAQLVQKALLDGKKVTVLLDFQPPQFKRGTLFEKVVDAVSALRDMGAEAVYLGAKPDEGYALITESEVNAAAARGLMRLQCATGAIVTPAARDAAKDKGIAIDL